MSKTMIFLLDGTANDASEINAETENFSNVYAINQLIADQKRESGKVIAQITFYLPGIGTKFTVRRDTIASKWLKLREYVFGDNLDQLVLRSYVNLVANYRPGDRLVLVGFSRGAAAARIFSRLISDFGVLRSEFLLHLDEIWRQFVAISDEENDKIYFDEITKLKNSLSAKYNRNAFHETPIIKFMGLYDTVTGRHDRGVASFLRFRDQVPASKVECIVHLLSMHENRKEFPLRRFELRDGVELREIWLPGVHADVGGGYKKNFLANIALLTMAEFLSKLGNVSLNREAVNELCETLCEDISRKADFVVNTPAKISGDKTLRYVRAGDEIHPIHWRLVGQTLRWKDHPGETLYENRMPVDCNEQDNDLSRWFDRCFGLSFHRLTAGRRNAA